MIRVPFYFKLWLSSGFLDLSQESIRQGKDIPSFAGVIYMDHQEDIQLVLLLFHNEEKE
jgi:hypothetical protein